MKRKIYDELLAWKREIQGKSALLIEGARRVGKSYIVEDFARDNYPKYLIIDCSVMSDEVKDIFYHSLDRLDEFFMLLSSYYNIDLVPRQTLIVFDEVQSFPRAREAIKRLVADGRFDYIETGSLISIKKNVKDILIPSEEQKLPMVPMDFEEFLWAINESRLMELIKQRYQDRQPLGPALHRRIMNCFRQYLIVGGMPLAVNAYVQSQDFKRVDLQKRQMLSLYRDDIRKFADNINLKVEQIFDEVPAQLQRHEKKFNLAALSPEARYREYYGAFYWLQDAKLVNIAHAVTEPNLGLRMSLDSNAFKCYFFDTGLLLSMAFDEKGLMEEEIYRKILFGKLEFNQGMIMENMVAQMLTAHRRQLYFYSQSDRTQAEERMEIDFLLAKSKITNRHNINPIEVKTGNNYTYNSLNKFLAKFRPYIHYPIIIHTNDLQWKNGILYLPVYMTGLL